MRLRSAVLALPLALLAAPPPVHLEGAPFLPYRINQAVLAGPEGMRGEVELQGVRWSGGRVPLFRTQVTARTEAVDLDFYLDEDIRALEVRVAGEEAQLLELDPVRDLDPAEGAVREMLRGLAPPIHLARGEARPDRFPVPAGGAAAAGFHAAAELFGVASSRTPLLVLGLFAAVVLAASALASRMPVRLLWALSLLAAGGASVVVVRLAAPRPLLIRVAFPGTAGSHVLVRQSRELPGYARVDYLEGGRPGSVDLVAFQAPSGRGIPVLDIVPPEGRVRFSAPPCITGDRKFEAEGFVTGWVLHAGR